MPMRISGNFGEFEQIPDGVAAEMVEAMGKIVKPAIQNSARQMLRRKGMFTRSGGRSRGTGETAESVVLTKLKKGKGGASYAEVTWDGNRSNGNARRRAEVAFVNEYGTDRRGIEEVPFMDDANNQSAERALDAAEEVFNRRMGE